MILSIKHRFSIYKRFEKDIWGINYTTVRLINRITSFFYKLYTKKQEYYLSKRRRYVYRIDIVKPKVRKRYLDKDFVTLRLVKLYYLIVTYKQFRKMARKAREMDNNFQSNYCLLLEVRLLPILYRTNFFISIFDVMAFIKSNTVLVNRHLINYLNYHINLFDVVTFRHNVKVMAFSSFMLKNFKCTYLFNTPRFMFMHYKFVFFFIEKFPVEKDFVFPIKIDIHRATGGY